MNESVRGPSPFERYPLPGFPQVGFLKPLITNPYIVVGDYTYYDDPNGPQRFEADCVLYHYPFIGDKLVIGKFCALARGVRFVMNGANHKTSGFSTYPFFIFGLGWETAAPAPDDLPYKGDTVVGNDVWLGYESLVMPGVTIGDGAVVAARAVVASDVPPYAIVGGNPARVIRQRFPEDIVAELLAIRWWDWPAEKVTRHLQAIVGADIGALRAAN
jgi:virginiamycin A acetyltransferase